MEFEVPTVAKCDCNIDCELVKRIKIMVQVILISLPQQSE